jgi:cytochrome c-type biogenesis protein CcmH
MTCRSPRRREFIREPVFQTINLRRMYHRFANKFAPTGWRRVPALRQVLAAVVLALGSTNIAHAAIDAYTFKNEAERARYTELTRELRCPKCQNQDIADSNAPIAADLRKEIYRMLGEGQSNQQIIDFMVDRYGEFVRYKPELNAHTWLLWFGPGGLLLGGVVLIGVIVARRRKQRSVETDVLSDEERQRLAHLLDNKPE